MARITVNNHLYFRRHVADLSADMSEFIDGRFH